MRAKTFKIAPFPVLLKLKFTSTPPAEDAVGLTVAEGGVIMVTICTSIPGKVFPTAVHESVHAAQFTEKYIEGELDDETQAYLIEHIASWIMSQYDKSQR